MVATRSDLRREALLDAAVRTIRRDGADASMNDIAAEAGITKPVLYQHFASKAGLAAALGERYLADLGATLADLLADEPDAEAAVTAGIRVFVTFAWREPELFRFLTEGSSTAVDDGPMVHALTDLLVAFVQGPAVGVADAGRARTWAVAVLAMIVTTVPWCRVHQPDRSRAQLVDDLAALVLGGLLGPSTPRPSTR